MNMLPFLRVVLSSDLGGSAGGVSHCRLPPWVGCGELVRGMSRGEVLLQRPRHLRRAGHLRVRGGSGSPSCKFFCRRLGKRLADH